MDSEIMVETLPLLGMCNLCLDEGAVKSMITVHQYNGQSEIYSDMLLKCFSLDVAALQLGDAKRLICNMCISKLRDSMLFKQQAIISLKTLEAAAKEEKDEKQSMDEVKKEDPGGLDEIDEADFRDVDDDDEDMNTAINTFIKKEKSTPRRMSENS